MKTKHFLPLFLLLISINALGWERETVWPKGKMPDAQEHQIAAMTDEAGQEKFNPKKHRTATSNGSTHPQLPTAAA